MTYIPPYSILPFCILYLIILKPLYTNVTAWLSHSCDQASLSILKAFSWSSSQNANCLTQFHTLCAFSITVLRKVLAGLRKVQYQVHRANKYIATVYLPK